MKRSVERSLELDRLLKELREPIVRDLAWVIASHHLCSQLNMLSDVQAINKYSEHSLCLLSLSTQSALEHAKPFLIKLDENPEPLRIHLQRSASQFKRVRLGVYFEHLVLYWLDKIIETSNIQREIQIFDRPQGEKGRQTIGAIDLITELKSKHRDLLICAEDEVKDLSHHLLVAKKITPSESLVVHWELASKFYLQVPSDEAHMSFGQLPSQLFEFVGPNERDSFGGKLHRLLTHQLPLSDRQEASAILASKGIQVNARALWLKGRLFIHALNQREILPYSQCQTKEPQSDPWNGFNESQALWLRQAELPRLFDHLFQNDADLESNEQSKKLKAILCEKPMWFAPPNDCQLREAPHLLADELLFIARSSRGERGATLWYIAHGLDSWRTWLMIVPDDWGQR